MTPSIQIMIECAILHRNHVDLRQIFNAYPAEARAACLKERIAPLVRDGSPRPLICDGVLTDNLFIIRLLLENGASPNGDRAPPGVSPLMLVSAHNIGFGAANALLKFKADPNLRNEWGQTALHYAATNDRLDVAKALVRAGGDINAVDETRQTPLHLCLGSKSYRLMEFLLDIGARRDIPNRHGETARDIAARMAENDWPRVRDIFKRAGEKITRAAVKKTVRPLLPAPKIVLRKTKGWTP